MGKKYVYPELDLLSESYDHAYQEVHNNVGEKIVDFFHIYKINVTLHEVYEGPLVTEYVISLEDGVRVHRILELEKDLRLHLGYAYLNIEFPVPGEPKIGINVPSDNRYILSLRKVLESNQFKNTKKGASFVIGRNMQNRTLMGDISDYPHMLVGGATGTGKSCFVDSIVLSMIYKYSPEEIQFIMIDSNGINLSIYDDLPHMAIPAIKDIEFTFQIFGWLKKKMRNRYLEFANYRVRKIQTFNEKMEREGKKKLPYIIVIIDDIAAYMKAAPRKTQTDVADMVLKARAAGIYMLFVTSNPTAKVLTPLIKGNLRSQFAFRVSSSKDSDNIINAPGAEKLLGSGECLYMCPGRYNLGHAQTPYVSHEDIKKVVSYVAKKNKGKFKSEVEMTEVLNEETGALF